MAIKNKVHYLTGYKSMGVQAHIELACQPITVTVGRKDLLPNGIRDWSKVTCKQCLKKRSPAKDSTT